MTERWEHMVRTLRVLDAPTERMWQHVERGPSPSQPSSGRHRVLTTIVALGLFAGSAVIVWEAFRPVRVSQTATTFSDGKIAFELWRPTQTDTRHLVYVLDPDGGSPTNVTPDNAEYSSPTWSPDGRWLAAVRLDPGLRVSVVILRPDGSGLRELLLIGADARRTVQQISWSPDGTRIGMVYVDPAGRRADEWVQRLYVMNADGTNLRPLTDESLRVTSFSWSPDGSRLVFSAGARGDGRAPSRIFVVEATGGSPTLLAGVTGSDPAWSPDGTKMAFAGHAPGTEESDIFSMNADGTQPVRLTTDPHAEFWPVWSPDGTQILFQRQEPGSGHGPSCSLVLMDASGREERVLLEGADLDGCPSRPSWQAIYRG